MAVKKRMSGITLTEMMLALAIFSMISVAVYAVFHSGVRAHSASRKNLRLQENLEKITDIMVSDFQQCRLLLSAGEEELSFWNTRGQKIIYNAGENIIYRNGVSILEDGLSLAHVKFSYFNGANSVENYGEGLNESQRSGVTLIEFIISITDGSQSMEILSAVNIKR